MIFGIFERIPWTVGELGKPPWRWKYGIGTSFTEAKLACQSSTYSLPPHHAAEMITRDVLGYSMHAWNNYELSDSQLKEIRETWQSVQQQMQDNPIGIIKRG